MPQGSAVQKKADKKKASGGAKGVSAEKVKKKVLKEGKSIKKLSQGSQAKQGNKGNFHGEALKFLESYQVAYIVASTTGWYSCFK